MRAHAYLAWDLCQLGGWKDPHTILKCYQTADEESMREALSRSDSIRLVHRM